jgi:hypothetical protein
MKLDFEPVPDWPKLAWVASFTKHIDTIAVYHGPCVETREQWCVEAAWAGEFSDGAFDLTDLVFGSGIRCRGNSVVFVSSGTTLERLWYVQRADCWFVANSLPAILAVAGLSLCDEYAGYPKDVSTIGSGLCGYKRSLPTDAEDVCVVYHSNLTYDGQRLVETPKPEIAPPFRKFADYQSFLHNAADALSRNISDQLRCVAIEPLTTLSRGYDSVATAVIARRVGCTRAATIRRSSSLWRGSDSGEDIAYNLGLSCDDYPRVAKHYPLEETIWAASGRAGIVNWTLFNYPEPLCLLFTGSYGDKAWGRNRQVYPDTFAGTIPADLGLAEFRLFKGIFLCPVPFWAMRHYQELQTISFSKEMEPWTLHNDYDRPIPRRIIEEAGVPRTAFGMRKMNTSHEDTYLWPYSPETKRRFTFYLRERNFSAPARCHVPIMRRLSTMSRLLYANVFRKMGMKDHVGRFLHTRASDMIFCWANMELKGRYAEGLQSSKSIHFPP